VSPKVLRPLVRLWDWAVVHDACFCRLGPLGSRLCGWIDQWVYVEERGRGE
jgi:hypothetical protein